MSAPPAVSGSNAWSLGSDFEQDDWHRPNFESEWTHEARGEITRVSADVANAKALVVECEHARANAIEAGGAVGIDRADARLRLAKLRLEARESALARLQARLAFVEERLAKQTGEWEPLHARAEAARAEALRILADDHRPLAEKRAALQTKIDAVEAKLRDLDAEITVANEARPKEGNKPYVDHFTMPKPHGELPPPPQPERVTVGELMARGILEDQRDALIAAGIKATQPASPIQQALHRYQ